MTDVKDVKKRAVALVGEIDETELAIRLIEAIGGLKRPPNMTNEQLLSVTPAEALAVCRIAARTAMAYVAECLAKGERPQ